MDTHNYKMKFGREMSIVLRIAFWVAISIVGVGCQSTKNKSESKVFVGDFFPTSGSVGTVVKFTFNKVLADSLDDFVPLQLNGHILPFSFTEDGFVEATIPIDAVSGSFEFLEQRTTPLTSTSLGFFSVTRKLDKGWDSLQVGGSGGDFGGAICGILEDNSLWCWDSAVGHGLSPKLPKERDDHTLNHPRQIEGSFGWFDLPEFLLLGNICSSDTNNNYFCWGDNSYGPLGNNYPQKVTGPIAMPKRWSKLFLGGFFVCADDGTGLYCWSDRFDNVEADFGMKNMPTKPTIIWDKEYIEIDLGWTHGCLIDFTNDLWCFGSNFNESFGSASTDFSLYALPVSIGSSVKWRKVSAGGYSTCAIDTDGQLWCWGSPQGVGTDSDEKSRVPLQLGKDFQWQQVDAGIYGTCAIREDHTIWCLNSDRELEKVDSDYTDWDQISVVSGNRLCAVRSNSIGYCSNKNAKDDEPFMKEITEVEVR